MHTCVTLIFFIYMHLYACISAWVERTFLILSCCKCLLCSFQGSPSEDRNFRSDVDDTETEEASFSGQEDSSGHIDILEWAKVL